MTEDMSKGFDGRAQDSYRKEDRREPGTPSISMWHAGLMKIVESSKSHLGRCVCVGGGGRLTSVPCGVFEEL